MFVFLPYTKDVWVSTHKIMKKTTVNTWNLTPQDVRAAIRSHFNIPADAQLEVHSDGSAVAVQTLPAEDDYYSLLQYININSLSKNKIENPIFRKTDKELFPDYREFDYRQKW